MIPNDGDEQEETMETNSDPAALPLVHGESGNAFLVRILQQSIALVDSLQMGVDERELLEELSFDFREDDFEDEVENNIIHLSRSHDHHPHREEFPSNDVEEPAFFNDSLDITRERIPHCVSSFGYGDAENDDSRSTNSSTSTSASDYQDERGRVNQDESDVLPIRSNPHRETRLCHQEEEQVVHTSPPSAEESKTGQIEQDEEDGSENDAKTTPPVLDEKFRKKQTQTIFGEGGDATRTTIQESNSHHQTATVTATATAATSRRHSQNEQSQCSNEKRRHEQVFPNNELRLSGASSPHARGSTAIRQKMVTFASHISCPPRTTRKNEKEDIKKQEEDSKAGDALLDRTEVSLANKKKNQQQDGDSSARCDVQSTNPATTTRDATEEPRFGVNKKSVHKDDNDVERLSLPPISAHCPSSSSSSSSSEVETTRPGVVSISTNADAATKTFKKPQEDRYAAKRKREQHQQRRGAN